MTVRIILTIALLAACAPRPAEVAGPASLSPVDIAMLQDDLIAANPGARAFSALDDSGFGVIVATDGTGAFVDPASATRVETTVSGFFGNTICLAEVGDWPGLCVDLFEDQSGGNVCDGTFGNGDLRSFACRLDPVGPGA